MPQGDEPSDNTLKTRRLMPRSLRSRVGLGVLLGVLIGAILAWSQRETIADDIISSQLAELGIDATYEIVSIGPRQQIIRNVIVGNAARPDLQIEEVAVTIEYGFSSPKIAALKLTRPRVNAHYDENDGLSFGELDTVIFAESEHESELPDFDLEIREGVVAVLSKQGTGSFRFAGSGGLADGFEGSISGNFMQIKLGGCDVANAKLDGTLRVEGRQPRFIGPLNLGLTNCNDGAGRIEPMRLDLMFLADRNLAGFSGEVALDAGGILQGGIALADAGGKIGLEQRDGILIAKFDLSGDELTSQQFSAERVGISGELRRQDQAGRVEIRGRVAAQDLRPGADLYDSIKSASVAASDTLAQPLLAKIRTALLRETPESSFEATFLMRQREQSQAVIVPQAMWKSASGDNLLSLSQLQFALESGRVSQVSGNLVSGGRDLPRLSGRMEQAPSGNTVLRLRMEPYSAGDASIAGPELALAQTGNGGFGISGRLIVSGDIPGGKVRQLDIPLQGGWSAGGASWLWRNCTSARFERLELSGLILEEQRLELCPSARRPILASGRSGTSFNLAIPKQAWRGSFDGEEAQIEVESAVFSSEEGLAATRVSFMSGDGEGQTRFVLDQIDGMSAEGWSGDFVASEIALGPVPLDMRQIAGKWGYLEGKLSVEEAMLSIHDRAKERRFNPLFARDAKLTLHDGVIRANATVRNAESDRAVSEVVISHELASGNGYADLRVSGLAFDKGLQPEQLSDLALGVIALAEGTLTGEGRIDWRDGEITSSGEVRTQQFDFAAEFGPVQGVSGKVRFSDLLELTTEPDQRLQIASINPGIEVFDGEMLFELHEGRIIRVKQGVWPFLGGTLILRPVEINFGAAEERRYIIEITGADAAQFIATMELSNLAATGTFDGTLPLVFDEFGNGRIEGGLLISRPPGGNLSYVGELTYEDLSAIGNFAFASLRSLDYNQMMVELNGPLTGEIVTSLRFDGVRQGEGTSKNLFTRQIAKLPIQFFVNVRAPFYQLLTSFQSMYDPSFLRDPRDLGLLETDGTRFVPAGERESDISDEPPIQRQESEQMQ